MISSPLKTFDLFCINVSIYFNAFQHSTAMFDFYTPRKRQKAKGFLMFSGGMEMEHCCKTLKNIKINGNIGTKWVNYFNNHKQIQKKK